MWCGCIEIEAVARSETNLFLTKMNFDLTFQDIDHLVAIVLEELARNAQRRGDDERLHPFEVFRVRDRLIPVAVKATFPGILFSRITPNQRIFGLGRSRLIEESAQRELIGFRQAQQGRNRRSLESALDQ